MIMDLLYLASAFLFGAIALRLTHLNNNPHRLTLRGKYVYFFTVVVIAFLFFAFFTNFYWYGRP